MPAWYATVEDVASALGAKSTAYNEADLRRAVGAGSKDVDDLCQYVDGAFRPWRATYYFDWPTQQTTTYYRLWLDALPLISVEMLVSGGVVLNPAYYNLEPNQYGPPYRRIELNRGSSAAFSYTGGTPQRAIGALGLWGMGDEREVAGSLVGSIDAVTTTIACSDASKLGTGDHIVIDSERMEVTGKSWAGAAFVGVAGLAASAAARTLPITGGPLLAGELLLIDSERVKVVDVAGSTITVERAQDGTPLAAHTNGATVYARRGLTVTRGARGSIASAHSGGAVISRHVVPADVNALTIASAIVTHLSEQAGYSSQGSGTGQTHSGPAGGLDTLRERVVSNYGRQMRTRVV